MSLTFEIGGMILQAWTLMDLNLPPQPQVFPLFNFHCASPHYIGCHNWSEIILESLCFCFQFGLLFSFMILYVSLYGKYLLSLCVFLIQCLPPIEICWVLPTVLLCVKTDFCPSKDYIPLHATVHLLSFLTTKPSIQMTGLQFCRLLGKAFALWKIFPHSSRNLMCVPLSP